MNADPIVAEIRKIRKKHAEKFNFDLRSIFEDIKSKQNKAGNNIVSRPPKRHLKKTGS
ncbi:MAG: hypothetical protein GKR87_11895 [Kiritimatiellae bacterium]|nr:hypothetical protein [Kiritimatiellia bacterium]